MAAREKTVFWDRLYLRRQIYNEEAKRSNRYSNGRYYRAGGVSRAPILRQELEDLDQQYEVLTQQIAVLRSLLINARR